jgi:YVTN family beta-propeller protein
VEFRILGPLEVIDGGRPLSIRRGKERALLIYLLLHANEVVPSGRLIDELWNERPPTTAAKILQNAVSHLRKELGEGRLVTRDPGYVLHVDAGELDVDRFERLAREGRADEALGLWRGMPLLDLHEEDFADEARRRLEEQRLAVVEDRIDAELAAGHHADVVGELEPLVAAHPLRERLYGQLMLALYRSGRQADALDVYRQARLTLSEELGLQPGPQLQELERRILTHEPGLEGTAAPGRAPPREAGSNGRRRIALLSLAVALILAAAGLGIAQLLGDDGARPVGRADSLVVIDPSSNDISEVVPVGSTPRGVAVGSTGVWVADALDNTVTWFDRRNLKVIRKIGIGAEAYSVAIGGGRVWVATANDDTLVELDEHSGGILETTPLSRDVDTAAAWSVTFGAGSVWVTSGERLLQIDPRTAGILSGDVGPPCCVRPAGVAVGARSVWVADETRLMRMSLRTGEKTGEVERDIYFDGVTFGFGRIWATTTDQHRQHPAVIVFHPESLLSLETRLPHAVFTEFHSPLGVASGAGGIWVADYAQHRVVRVDPNTGEVAATVRVGGKPWGITVADGRVWVTVD